MMYVCRPEPSKHPPRCPRPSFLPRFCRGEAHFIDSRPCQALNPQPLNGLFQWFSPRRIQYITVKSWRDLQSSRSFKRGIFRTQSGIFVFLPLQHMLRHGECIEMVGPEL